jgi:MerR family transcriptional regulator, light-induced transcriptional regulator
VGYRIKTVAELVGVPKNTLLAWERRYGLVEPARLSNGYRVYSEGDVSLLRRVKRALDEGLKISEAVDLVRTGREGSASQAIDRPLASVGERLEKALLAFDRAGADEITRRLVGVPFARLIDDVYLPILRDVGARWARGEISVAQEHHASSFIRDQLTAMLLSVGPGPDHGTHVACMTFPGEHHELALLALAVRLALASARVTYLGASMPVDDLLLFAREQRPAWLLVSVIVTTPCAAIIAFAETLRRTIPAETRLVLGGAGLPDDLRLAGVRFEADWHNLEIV